MSKNNNVIAWIFFLFGIAIYGWFLLGCIQGSPGQYNVNGYWSCLASSWIPLVIGLILIIIGTAIKASEK